MSEFVNHREMPASASLAELTEYKLGGLVTGERMGRALVWARHRREMDHITNPVREFMQQIKEVATSKHPVAGRLLARTIIDPEGFVRAQLNMPDYDPSVSADLSVAIQRARRAGVLELKTAYAQGAARAIATPALLLTALDEPVEAWLPEQVRVAEPEFDMQTLWERLEPSRIERYRDAMDRKPLP